MLRFEGDTNFPQPPAAVFARLSDARFLVQCIPGVESVSQAEPTVAVCVLRTGFSFIRGTLEITLRVVEAVEPQLLRFHAHGKGIGSSNDVEAVLNFAPLDGGTRIHWSADITNLTGLIKAVPQGLLKGAAQKVIADVWTTVQARMGS
jgi:carbon monoxide dehydrogenase subunit G